MLRPPLSLTLLLVLSLGCTDSGAPLSNSSQSSGAGINGPHTGEIWTANSFSGSNRFNLQTSQTTKVSEGLAFPNNDGSAFVEVFLDSERVDSLSGCLWDDLHQFNVRDTRTGAITGSFELRNRDVKFPVRLSQDGQRIAMYVSEDGKNCGTADRIFNKRLSVFSKNGEELYRHFNDKNITYDWDPQGHLVIVTESSAVSGRYVLQIETTPGIYIFNELLSWTPASDVTGYVAFRVGPTGKDAVIEEVTDTAHFLSGFSWRNGRTRHFTMYEIADESEMFQHDLGDTPRVNAPVFSPDGQHILVTEGFSQGSVVFNATSLQIDTLEFDQTGSEIDELETFSVLSASSESKSYIVPTGVKLQPMPPVRYSDNIRPVLADGGDGMVSLVNFNPIHTVTWTPVID